MTKRILKRAETAEVARKDDNLETLKKRFKVFVEQTMPVVDQFKEMGKCKVVESIGSVESIYANIRKHFIQALVKPKGVFVLGGPGAGKGTQCTTLVQDDEFKAAFAHLSAGDLLRAERNSGSEDAELINNYIKEGKIVPVEITVGLIKNAMNKLMAEEGKYVFIIDGFPRNQDNLEGWNKVMGTDCDVKFLLFLDCTEDEMTKRILDRAAKSEVKRKDDNEETLKKRFKVYMESTMPIVEIFEGQQKLAKVSSMGSVEDIYGNVRKHFVPFVQKPNVVFVLGGPGAGKGTQCVNLVRDFGVVHLSAGDLLRAERNSGSKDAELINNYIKEGQIVPVKITVGLIKKAMKKYVSYGQSDFVIDGFPRNKDNLDGSNALISEYAEVPFLLLLECTEEEMTNRIMKRAESSAIKRKDDNLETLKKRFKVFKESTMPIVAAFEKQEKCIKVESM